MARKKTKYYVVWVGHKPGIYDTWADAEAQIKGAKGAKYKSFSSLTEAKEAFESGAEYAEKKQEGSTVRAWPEEVILPSISVDAACSGNPGDLEYQGVWTEVGGQIFHQGPFLKGTNNVGEFLGIVHALALIKKNEWPPYTIYSDSKVAMGWVVRKKCNTKLTKTKDNENLFDLIHRAEQWLRSNTYDSLILKWETKIWGEIPADFGRK